MVSAGAISERLAEYVDGTAFGDLPSEVVAKTKQIILDTLGCMLAGSRDRVGEMITAHASRQGRAGPCTIFGRSEPVAPEHAALANGTTAHVLELDDGHRPSDNHLASVVVPAAVAMAQALRSSGPELILATVLGYDVMGRVGEAVLLPRQRQHFHGTGTTGVFGAAAAAGKLMGLDQGQLVHALGIAGDGASSLSEYRSSGADCKPLHAGRGAQDGITAAMLAADGFQGPLEVFEGQHGFCTALGMEPRPEMICVELGERFAVIESGFKAHASTGGNFTSIDAALWLRREHGLEPAAIERVRVALPRWAQDQPGRKFGRPESIGMSRPNVRFVVAAALHDGELTHRQHTPAKLVEPGIVALMERIEFVVDTEIEAIYEATKDDPQFFVPCAVEIESGGRSYRRLERTPLGYNPERGLSEQQVADKFRSLVAGVLTPASAERVVEWANELHQAGNAGELAELLVLEDGAQAGA